jgi:hypothetical protein
MPESTDQPTLRSCWAWLVRDFARQEPHPGLLNSPQPRKAGANGVSPSCCAPGRRLRPLTCSPLVCVSCTVANGDEYPSPGVAIRRAWRRKFRVFQRRGGPILTGQG